MNERLDLQKVNLVKVGSILLPLLLFWGVLFVGFPVSFSQYFHPYSWGLFLIVLVLYHLFFCLPDRFQVPAALALTMLLFALPLSYLWTSGFSDNFVIGGLVPYKDGRYYYMGADLILHGFPVIDANQATERPLFPGFLASVLFLTGQNLKISIAIIAQLMGLGLYLAAHQIKNLLGGLAASLFATLLYFYIKPWIGYTMSETLGFAVGCFGFTLLYLSIYKLKWRDLLLGLFVLLLAVSARAGAFFIFPLLALWIGWVMRGEKRFSLKSAGFALVFILMGYFLVNSVYAQLLGIPPGASFGNFSYALYGQVHGGTGWHSAVEELGTRNPAVVYRAAWEFFLKHPMSLLIGCFKAYRDFFLIGEQSIFPILTTGQYYWLNFILWLGTMLLLILGLMGLVKDMRSHLSSLFLAGFIGVFISIPFLPPVDGGTRFYASTVPFFFVLPSLGVSWGLRGFQQKMMPNGDLQAGLMVSRFTALVIIIMTLFLPLAIRALSYKPTHTVPVCAPEQEPFIIELHPGSYIDLVKTEASQCGPLPEVCLNDLMTNNTEKSTDDFYQKIFSLMESSAVNARLVPAIELITKRFRYFYIPYDKLSKDSLPGLLSGCAIELSTKNQTIFQVESIFIK
jgi:hypothetical protein